MGARELLQVRVNDELVLHAGGGAREIGEQAAVVAEVEPQALDVTLADRMFALYSLIDGRNAGYRRSRRGRKSRVVA